MSNDEGPSARQLIAEADERTISEVLRALGEEDFARPIARSIKRAARMETTLDLVRAVEAAVPRARWPKRIHVATRTFQGIRLWVNQELESLDGFLRDLPSLLGAGARAVIISFHSLEDRAVKRRFRELEGGCTCPPKMPVCVCGAKGGRLSGPHPSVLIVADEASRSCRAESPRAQRELHACPAKSSGWRHEPPLRLPRRTALWPIVRPHAGGARFDDSHRSSRRGPGRLAGAGLCPRPSASRGARPRAREREADRRGQHASARRLRLGRLARQASSMAAPGTRRCA